MIRFDYLESKKKELKQICTINVNALALIKAIESLSDEDNLKMDLLADFLGRFFSTELLQPSIFIVNKLWKEGTTAMHVVKHYKVGLKAFQKAGLIYKVRPAGSGRRFAILVFLDKKRNIPNKISSTLDIDWEGVAELSV